MLSQVVLNLTGLRQHGIVGLTGGVMVIMSGHNGKVMFHTVRVNVVITASYSVRFSQSQRFGFNMVMEGSIQRPAVAAAMV